MEKKKKDFFPLPLVVVIHSEQNQEISKIQQKSKIHFIFLPSYYKWIKTFCKQNPVIYNWDTELTAVT